MSGSHTSTDSNLEASEIHGAIICNNILLAQPLVKSSFLKGGRPAARFVAGRVRETRVVGFIGSGGLFEAEVGGPVIHLCGRQAPN